MNQNPPPPCACGRLLAVLVGLFATWQLVAIPAMNLILLVPLRAEAPLQLSWSQNQARGTFTASEQLQGAADRAGFVLERWAEFSGQGQGWVLFAPGPPPYTVFVATEFQWPDGDRDTLLSRYEPRDLANPPLRAPLVHCRHHHFEMQFVYPVWYASPEVVADFPHLWGDLPDEVRLNRTEIRAFLRWRLNDYLAANPRRARPHAVVLKHRYITTPPPDAPGAARKIEEQPYARWHPETDEMEAFDRVAQRYIPLDEVKP